MTMEHQSSLPDGWVRWSTERCIGYTDNAGGVVRFDFMEGITQVALNLKDANGKWSYQGTMLGKVSEEQIQAFLCDAPGRIGSTFRRYKELRDVRIRANAGVSATDCGSDRVYKLEDD